MAILKSVLNRCERGALRIQDAVKQTLPDLRLQSSWEQKSSARGGQDRNPDLPSQRKNTFDGWLNGAAPQISCQENTELFVGTEICPAGR
ncbi:hypothetical protein A2480_00945 [Candidatus Uhrbacteria bacterium RIFOXYC2_FULL_47_19]|uniref:Uncharacterized protein n=1 Tax=Candidatus Uhrbacteria bacterium RIFOXYC2_FULL_47_19 TaxID=1802424 RepID=A0A1F7WCV2_9BACT|nr:MAG: hypothetical protein A2480_00945 [Candidatus Uhrbacteria bacterium RIFOXYC2_FULL_47_19]